MAKSQNPQQPNGYLSQYSIHSYCCSKIHKHDVENMTYSAPHKIMLLPEVCLLTEVIFKRGWKWAKKQSITFCG